MSHISTSHLLGDNMLHISTGPYDITASAGQTIIKNIFTMPLNLGGFRVMEVREYTYSISNSSNPPPVDIYMGHIQSGSPLRYRDMIDQQEIALAGGLKNYRFAIYFELKPFSSANNQALQPGESLYIEHYCSVALTAKLRFEIFGLCFGDHRNWPGG